MASGMEIVKAMEKLGLRRDIDLALHLPLRYEDETRIVPLAQARDGALASFHPVRDRVRFTRYGTDCYALGLLASGHADLVIETGDFLSNQSTTTKATSRPARYIEPRRNSLCRLTSTAASASRLSRVTCEV